MYCPHPTLPLPPWAGDVTICIVIIITDMITTVECYCTGYLYVIF